MVNYGFSTTVALETPWFTTAPAMYASLVCVSTGSNDGVLLGRYQAIIRVNTGILLFGILIGFCGYILDIPLRYQLRVLEILLNGLYLYLWLYIDSCFTPL